MTSKLVARIIGSAALGASLTSGQLRLIVGSPVPTGNINGKDTAIVAVEPDGKTWIELELAKGRPDKQNGLSWIEVAHDLGIALLLVDGNELVVDLNTASVVKTCKIPIEPGMGTVDEWLLDEPTLGPMAVSLMAEHKNGSIEASSWALVGMRADPSVPCEKRGIRLSEDRVLSLATSGEAGVGGQAIQSRFVAGFSGGKAWVPIGSARIYFPFELPLAILNTLPSVPLDATIHFRNRQIEAISISDVRAGMPLVYLVRQRPNENWVQLPIPPDHNPDLRGFGTFVAWSESVHRRRQDEKIRTGKMNASARVENAGSEEWRKTDSRWGTGIETTVGNWSRIFPGSLHLYDVRTQRHYTIETRQSDSEILLIQDNDVYYRISDRLYRAGLRVDSLTPGRQIAKSEIIRDAHWAFIRTMRP